MGIHDRDYVRNKEFDYMKMEYVSNESPPEEHVEPSDLFPDLKHVRPVYYESNFYFYLFAILVGLSIPFFNNFSFIVSYFSN